MLEQPLIFQKVENDFCFPILNKTLCFAALLMSSPKSFLFVVLVLKASHTVSAPYRPAAPGESMAQQQLQSFTSRLWFSSCLYHFYSAIIPLTSAELLLINTYIAESGHVVST